MLICDNLDGQTCEAFRDKVAGIGGQVCYRPKNRTDLWQPVDSGYGRMLKVLAKNEQQKWLESDENLRIWLRDSTKLTAKERRILLTHWVGEAHLTNRKV